MSEIETPTNILVCELESKIIAAPTREEALKRIEQAARVCYKSEDRISEDSAVPLIKNLLKRKHMTPFEHVSVTVKFQLDRALQNELVRHRLASMNVSSTRYCNYTANKFDGKLSFIQPDFKNTDSLMIWLNACVQCADNYTKLVENGEAPEMARSVLLLSLKTEVVFTANLREWLHIFDLRTDPAAHPQMRKVMIELQDQFKELYPEIFA